MSLEKFMLQNTIEAGTDEAGRGCLAGPVVAAAVILPSDFDHPLLNDSKKLSKKHRDLLRPIIEREAVAFGVSFIHEAKIDEINILKASILGMHESIKLLSVQPEHILVDGNRFFPFENIPHTTVVKGDGKYLNIAAASVLAKTYRDDFMEQIHNEFPVYQWSKNRGYPTKTHRNAIREYGPTKYHRKSFKLLPDEQLKISFD